MIGYKATNKDMKCRNFQFELGYEYKENKAELCSSGFHFCKNPLDVLNYYDLCDSRFFEIEAKNISEEIQKEDSKRVSKNIKFKTELGLNNLIILSFEYIKNQAKIKDDENVVRDDGDSSQVATSGNYSKVATSGNYSQVATSGYYSQVATSGNYSKVATSGYSSQVATSGYSSKVALNGDYSIGMCAGMCTTIKGKKGDWITLAEWEYSNKLDKYIPVCVKSKKIDGKKLKEDTWYKLENKKFVEVVNANL